MVSALIFSSVGQSVYRLSGLYITSVSTSNIHYYIMYCEDIAVAMYSLQIRARV